MPEISSWRRESTPYQSAADSPQPTHLRSAATSKSRIRSCCPNDDSAGFEPLAWFNGITTRGIDRPCHRHRWKYVWNHGRRWGTAGIAAEHSAETEAGHVNWQTPNPILHTN